MLSHNVKKIAPHRNIASHRRIHLHRKVALALAITLQVACSSTVFAQLPVVQLITVSVTPDHVDWIYKLGEPVKFHIRVIQNGHPIDHAGLKYEIGPERRHPWKQDSAALKSGDFFLDGGTLKTPGFLRCSVWVVFDGITYTGLGTAGYEPYAIQPTIQNPVDFSAFWDKAMAENAKLPLDAIMTLLPDRCTSTVDVYQVNLQNYRPGDRLYGILCLPKKPGKYPAILEVPGAGVTGFYGDVRMADRGFITFQIGIHDIPLTMDTSVYKTLASGALAQYYNINLDDRDRYYYKRVYLGCVKANDFLVSLPQYDGVNLAVTGGSQGGALSIVTAALDPRVKCLADLYPALCDLTGDLHGRAGGWPHLFDSAVLAFNNKKDKIETAGYYDVVNFARLLKVPGKYTWGFNDLTCPPTSTFAAYNVITAPKELILYPETGHWNYLEQRQKLWDWLEEKLKKP